MCVGGAERINRRRKKEGEQHRTRMLGEPPNRPRSKSESKIYASKKRESLEQEVVGVISEKLLRNKPT